LAALSKPLGVEGFRYVNEGRSSQRRRLAGGLVQVR
ncbi:MAG: hypothetical protein JWN92_1805, partial [Candidatus Acidoferrum typicum]|nr:hypothetical protein [Candidatus Acidoferrum typicum]